ncbi:hypothetical protein XELAEV_18023328mg [Xenopus laevis]|uniref:Uncharacterized protein n=1 Tax=Xenopus laevis TaxID=8355 RepID=A0A974D405_XENLA|nr:hypothetical protein XELAEV_18023328mg [Xenopus laevis]
MDKKFLSTPILWPHPLITMIMKNAIIIHTGHMNCIYNPIGTLNTKINGCQAHKFMVIVYYKQRAVTH